MGSSYLKILIFAVLALFMVFGPMSLTITATPSGLAYAQPPGHGGTPPGQGGTPPGHGGTPPGQQQRHSSSPEPATWLLIGSGVAGLVLLRKKFKN